MGSILLVILFSASFAQADAQLDKDMLAKVDQSSPCEGVDILSEEGMHTYVVPAVCGETKDYLARVEVFEEQAKAQCHADEAKIFARIRTDNSCAGVKADAEGMQLLAQPTFEKANAYSALKYEKLAGAEAKIPVCHLVHEQIATTIFFEITRLSFLYFSVKNFTNSPCDPRNTNWYPELPEKSET